LETDSSLSEGVEIVKTLADCLEAITHSTRLKILQYCLQPSRFTDIIFNLRLNPASFRFHVKVLTERGLVKKVKRGVYETTELGELLLKLVEQANRIASKQCLKRINHLKEH